MTQPKLKIVERSINEIKPYNKNPRHNDEAVAEVAASIEAYGFQQPIVVDKDDIIIVGHTRLEAAQELGMTTVPVITADTLSQAEVNAYRLADNKTNQFAKWDWTTLAGEIKWLEDGEDDLYTGFSTNEINDLLQLLEDPEEEEGDVGSLSSDEIITQPGDIWICGNHRVMCGSSTEEKDVQKLMGSEEAAMMWTDPPYNVAYESAGDRFVKHGANKKIHKSIANDDMDANAFEAFLTDFLTNAKDIMKPGACYYIARGGKDIDRFHNAVANAGLHQAQTLTWIKDRAVFSRMDYNPQEESIIYGWKKGAAHYFVGDFTKTSIVADDRKPFEKMTKAELVDLMNDMKTDLLYHDRPSRSVLHPTMKPPALIEEMLMNSSHAKQIVYDAFGGSGSTMIACENTGRYARLIELDPQYVDVIVKRWERFTSRKATHADTGLTFPDYSDEQKHED